MVTIKFTMDDMMGPVVYLTIFNKKFALCSCHRKTERSMWFFGLEKYLCSRCLGILLGGLIASFIHFYGLHFSLLFSLVLTIPLFIDGFSQSLGYRESNNSLRIITGILFGLAINYVGVIL
ncbi:DUF2085 domain-containing protein [Candidatus Woesearchaeota archaeon]|nr:DUF2085 domain-containing protein [Candidatus Woesearchaeota archaeon]